MTSSTTTTRVLRLDSSIFGAGGASTQLNQQLVDLLQNKSSGNLQITHRDLTHNPLPYVSVEFLQALGKPTAERSQEEAALVAVADELIEELRAADVLIIGAPMYNFTVPSTLKTWMDYVARAGATFKYTEAGAVGLLANTKVYINTSRGGLHKNQPTDGIVPLLTSFFAMLGLTDVSVTYAEGLNLGADSRDQALIAAQQSLNHLAA